MGVFKVPIEIGDVSGGEFKTPEAVADAGATCAMLPGSVLARLGIAPYRRRAFVFSDGNRREFDMARAAARIDGEETATIVMLGDENAAPIPGTRALEGLGLAVAPTGQRLAELEGRLQRSLPIAGLIRRREIAGGTPTVPI